LEDDDDIIHDGPIDEAAILKWGYIENYWFMEQDEDLLLMDAKHYPALFKLINDPDCPKGPYAMGIIDYALILHTLYDQDRYMSDLDFVIDLGQRVRNSKAVDWIRHLKIRREYLSYNRAVDKKVAYEMGHALLNGICREADIVLFQTVQKWVVELSVPPYHTHKEWLTIKKSSGEVLKHFRHGLPSHLKMKVLVK